MGRKVILDVDPGIDDAMALCLALSDPELEVVAVTAVGGNVSPAQATRNVQAIIERLDPPRWPRLGAASEPDNRLAVDRRSLYGSDGLGGTGFVVAERQHLLPSEKVICDQVRDAPHSVTIVALGPLTNIARAFIRDPELPTLVGRIVIMGGTVSGPGQHHAGGRVQHVLRSGLRPGRLPFAFDEDADPVGRHESDRTELRSVQQAARRIDQGRPASAATLAGGVPRLPPAVRARGNPRPRHGDAACRCSIPICSR